MTINDYLKGFSFMALCFGAVFFMFWVVTDAPNATALSNLCVLLTLLLDRLDKFIEDDHELERPIRRDIN